MQKLLIPLFILFLSFNSYGQLSLGGHYGQGSFGINLEPKSLDDNQVPLVLPYYGIVGTFNNQKNAGIQFEINYAKKGWREELVENPEAFFQRTISYLELPILSHFELGKKRVRLLILAGPYFAWKVSESTTQNAFESIISANPYNHYEEEIKNFNLGIRMGTGLRYNITDKLGIYAEIRYDLQTAGSMDIFEDRPNKIAASRLTETSLNFGILWHIKPQEKEKDYIKYTPKEDLYVD